jgi:hypothetical protein
MVEVDFVGHTPHANKLEQNHPKDEDEQTSKRKK